MKKAFYTFGAIYLAYKLINIAIGETKNVLIWYDEEIKHPREKSKQKNVKQPIGFAVERVES